MQIAMKNGADANHEVVLAGPRVSPDRFARPDDNVPEAAGPRNLEVLLWYRQFVSSPQEPCLFWNQLSMPVSRSMPILAWLTERPAQAFAAFLGLHAAVWTALPTLLYPNLPLDLIEALIYGASGSLAMTSCRRCPGGWSRSQT